MRLYRAISVVLGFGALTLWGAVRIEVLRGEGSNNNAVEGVGVSPAVRVLDDSGKPVRGVLVVFSAPDQGASVSFGPEGASAHGLTDESGVMVAPPARPVGGNGPVEIRVMANQGAEFVNTIIHQMNLGVGPPKREQELNLVKVPEPGAEPPHNLVLLRVRVEDGNGRPVPMATVSFVLRKLGNGGKAEEILRDTVSSGSNGEAVQSFPRRSGNQRLQFMVRAEAGGRRCTGYFGVD